MLLAVATVPSVRNLPVAGIPEASPVPDSPAVGDCVLDPIDPSWDNPGVADSSSGSGSATTYSYPRLAMSPCQGSRYGEVTAVMPTLADPVMSISSDGTFVNDANVETCPAAASRYVGIAMTGAQRAPLLGPWYPSQIVEAAASIPSARQVAAGQHWLACIVYLGASPVNPQATADQERYDGPLRDAMSTGRQRNRFGTCAIGTDLTGGELGLIGCGTVHQSEVFAAGGSDTHSVARADLQETCNQIAERLTGIPQLATVGLTVQVQAIDSNGGADITAALIPNGVNLSCGVTAEHQRKLNGSLLALGTAPIPWA